MKGKGQARAQGELRQSQLIGTYGPGSLLDLPRHSVLVAGLEHWTQQGRRPVPEPRLVAKIEETLGRQGIQLFTPPVGDGEPGGQQPGISVFTFPEWFITDPSGRNGTMRSRLLVPHKALTKNFYIDDDKKRRPVVPVRFVRACRKGHIGDIDWRRFVHRGDIRCYRQLYVDERGTSGDLSEVWIRCGCPAERPMSDAAKLANHALGFCDGSRPWLGRAAGQDCTEPNRLLLRSASNSYFAQVLTVISLPDRDTEIVKAVDRVWEILQAATTSELIETFRKIPTVDAALSGLTSERVLEEIQSRLSGKSEHAGKSIKSAEVETLLAAKEEIGEDVPDGTFFARSLPKRLWEGSLTRDIVDRVVLVHRLREVTAQIGFTRFEAVAPDQEGELDLEVEPAPLALEETWLPAVENRGEGIFVTFRQRAMAEWLSRSAVHTRGGQLERGFEKWKVERRAEKASFPGLPFIMIHSLSHLLLTAISLDCGYPASSIRERVYAGTGGFGILLYTSSPDAEGTLGGLVESGRKIHSYLEAAVDLGRLCSNDPVCAAHDPADELTHNHLLGAACHGCLLIAETSCEVHNRFLDRALVVPTIETADAAFLTG